MNVSYAPESNRSVTIMSPRCRYGLHGRQTLRAISTLSVPKPFAHANRERQRACVEHAQSTARESVEERKKKCIPYTHPVHVVSRNKPPNAPSHTGGERHTHTHTVCTLVIFFFSSVNLMMWARAKSRQLIALSYSARKHTGLQGTDIYIYIM